jgi:hypothetical protein
VLQSSHVWVSRALSALTALLRAKLWKPKRRQGTLGILDVFAKAARTMCGLLAGINLPCQCCHQQISAFLAWSSHILSVHMPLPLTCHPRMVQHLASSLSRQISDHCAHVFIQACMCT